MFTSGREANPDGRAEEFRPAYRAASQMRIPSEPTVEGGGARLPTEFAEFRIVGFSPTSGSGECG